MKLALVSSYISLKEGTGIARYYFELKKRLKKAKLMEGKNTVISHVFTFPFKMLRISKNVGIIHTITTIDALGFIVLRHKNVKKIVTYHDIGSLIHKETTPTLRMRIFSKLYLSVGFWADKVIAVSTLTRLNLIRFIKIDENKITMINNGVCEEFEPLKNRSFKSKKFTIGYIGALHPRKGVDFVLRALAIFRMKYGNLNIEFRIYGEGPYFYHLKNLTSSLNISDWVKFMDFAPDEKLVKFYNSFDIFVLASDWEGFGIPILEAQRCMIPVIVKQNAEIPEEVTRYCIKMESEEDLARKIYELIVSPKLRRKIAYGGYKYSKKFSWDKTAGETLQVYRSLLAK